MKTNCFMFAVRKWWREGGYIAIRKSRHLPILHFIWVKSLDGCEIQHYVPVEPRKGLRGLCHKMHFEGKIKTTD